MSTELFSPRNKRLAWMATGVAVLLAGYWSFRIAITENHHEDLWIYSSGAHFGFKGITPYNTERMHGRVEEQYPDDKKFIANNGYFLAPQAMLIYGPISMLPWLTMKLVWCSLTVLMGAAVGWGLSALAGVERPSWFTAACVIFVLCNPLTLFVLIVGQTPVMILFFIVMGELAYRRGWKILGIFLWALVFFKPHIALPLLPMAWIFSGWKRAAGVAVLAGLLNLVAGLVTTGNPLLVLEYLAYIPEGHKTVVFNKAEFNEQILSWNRLLIAFGGPKIELSAVGTIAGYAVWFVLCAMRSRFIVADKTWIFAVAGCGMMLCCQLGTYDMPLLALTLPYLGKLAIQKSLLHRAGFVAIVLAMTYGFFDGGKDGLAVDVATAIGDFFNSPGLTVVLRAHRSIGILTVSMLIFALGPVLDQTTRRANSFSWSAIFRALRQGQTVRV